MSQSTSSTRTAHVLAAIGIVVLLSGILVVRLSARGGSGAEPPRPVAAGRPATAIIPAPRPFQLAELSVPCWSCPEAQGWPIAYKTDLDLLAPLGTGSANAAVWFADFAKVSGKRAAEATAAMARRVDAPVWGKVLPADDPLLREAEPWCDQATMHFYPDVIPITGVNTELPNLLLPLTYARSWVARGATAKSFDAAMVDFRRAIRLGRLLRQEDAVLITDLVGLACVRLGAEGIYERSRREGRTELALLAAVVIGESAPQKLLTAARVTSIDLAAAVRKEAGGFVLDLPDERFKQVIALAEQGPERRFRGEATVTLRVIANLGTASQKEQARAALERLAASGDKVLAANARWCLDAAFTPAEVEALTKSPT